MAAAAVYPLIKWWVDQSAQPSNFNIIYLLMLVALFFLVIVAPATMAYATGFWIAALVRWRQARSLELRPGLPSAAP